PLPPPRRRPWPASWPRSTPARWSTSSRSTGGCARGSKSRRRPHPAPPPAPDPPPTEDLAEALDENEPWTPPDVPQLAPTVTEQRGGWAQENALALSEWEDAGGDPDDLLDEEDRAARDGISAPDLARADLDRAAEGGQLPSLAPTAATPGGDPEAEPEPFETRTCADDMVAQVPGTAKGPGAVGEYETEGGEL